MCFAPCFPWVKSKDPAEYPPPMLTMPCCSILRPVPADRQTCTFFSEMGGRRVITELGRRGLHSLLSALL